MKTKTRFLVRRLAIFSGCLELEYANKSGDFRRFFPGTTETQPAAKFRTMEDAQAFIRRHSISPACIVEQSPPPPGKSTYPEALAWISPELAELCRARIAAGEYVPSILRMETATA